MDVALFNQRLLDNYGLHTEQAKPKYRLVYSANEKEKRILYPEGSLPYSVEVPKYSQIKPPKYILEGLQHTAGSRELAVNFSYEPIWVFGKLGDPNGEPIEPTWVAIEFILNTLYHRSHAPYVASEDGTLESRQKQADELFDTLFGNETSVGDALAHKEGVIVPRNFGD